MRYAAVPLGSPLENVAEIIQYKGMSAIEEIEKRVLALPVRQRVFLVESLIDSLPFDEKEMTDAEELAEVDRRERGIETGQVQPLSDAEFWNSIEAGGDK